MKLTAEFDGDDLKAMFNQLERIMSALTDLQAAVAAAVAKLQALEAAAAAATVAAAAVPVGTSDADIQAQVDILNQAVATITPGV